MEPEPRILTPEPVFLNLFLDLGAQNRVNWPVRVKGVRGKVRG